MTPGDGGYPLPMTRKKRLGQHFLANRGTARALVDTFAPGPADTVVEIGPGGGALTRLLAERAGRLVALELDRDLVPALVELLAPFPRAEVRQADALAVDWAALREELGGPFRVIGNLPYNVGTAIVRRLLVAGGVRDMQFVLQKEVADRILADPGSRSYGPLSVLAALRCRRRRLRVLPPGAFRPPPRVTSVALSLEFLPHPPLVAAELPLLEEWLHAGFGHRRKTLAGNLGPLRERVRGWLEERGLAADSRAEALAPGDWLALFRALGPFPGRDRAADL